MPCDTAASNNARRKRAIEESIARLRQSLAAGTTKVTISRATGALVFTGQWQEQRDGVADVCAYRKLSAAGSPELRQAIARAEAISGTKLNRQVVEAGVHSHDGGATWHAGH